MSATSRTLQSLRFAVKQYANTIPKSFQLRRPHMMATHRAAARRALSSSTSSVASSYPYKSHMTTPALQQQAQRQQQQQEEDSPYISELQDLFDQMEQDPRSSTLGVNEAFLTRKEKRLDCGIPESALRFKTTSYGGRLLQAPHVHPNEHRVVLLVSVNDLGLTETETLILQEIVGNRLNNARQELRLTSNQFGSRIENKRHLVSMLNRIITSCRRLASDIIVEDDNDVEQA